MFRDAKEELERLQQELLEEEETKVLPIPTPRQIREEEDRRMVRSARDADDLEDIADFLNMDEEELDRLLNSEPGGAAQPDYRNYSNGYGRRPQFYDMEQEPDDPEPDDYDTYEDTEPERPRSLKGLILLAAFLLLGIGCVLLYWVVRLL